MTHFCTQCGNLIDEETRFCPKCGKKSGFFVNDMQPDSSEPASNQANPFGKETFTFSQESFRSNIDEPLADSQVNSDFSSFNTYNPRMATSDTKTDFSSGFNHQFGGTEPQNGFAPVPDFTSQSPVPDFTSQQTTPDFGSQQTFSGFSSQPTFSDLSSQPVVPEPPAEDTKESENTKDFKFDIKKDLPLEHYDYKPFNSTPRPTDSSEVTVPTGGRVAKVSKNIDKKGEGIVGVGTFFWLELLFKIPVIGFIFEILFCFIPRKKSLKHFAAARLIHTLIATIVFLLITVAVAVGIIIIASVLDSLTVSLEDMTPDDFINGLKGVDINQILDMLKGFDIDSIVKIFENVK